MLLMRCNSICQQIWKTQQQLQDWKRSVFTPIWSKGNAKECSNYRTVVLISHPSKVTLRILQAQVRVCEPRISRYTKWVSKLGFEQAEQQEIKLPTFTRSWRKQENFRKISTFVSLTTTLKPLTEWITTNSGKFLKRWEYQTTLPASCETRM